MFHHHPPGHRQTMHFKFAYMVLHEVPIVLPAIMDGYYFYSLSSVTLPSPNKFPTHHSHEPRHLSPAPRMAASCSFLQGSSACPPSIGLVGTGRRGGQLTWGCWDWTGSRSHHPEETAGSPCHHSCQRGWRGEGREGKGVTFQMNHVSTPQSGPAMWPGPVTAILWS